MRAAGLRVALLLGLALAAQAKSGGEWTEKGEAGKAGVKAGSSEAGAPAPVVDEARRLVLSNIEHTLWHEAGHLLVSELHLPVIGQEEDAADAFATLMMLTAEAGEEERVERLLDVAEVWLVSHSRSQEMGVEPDYFDEHALDAQRGLRVICFLAGGDPDRAGRLTADWGLPRDRAGRCAKALARAVESWDALLAPHYRAEDEPAAQPIEVRYAPGDGGARGLLESAGLLEDLAGALSATFRLEPGIVVEADRCGQPNASWDSEARRITLCYELVPQYEDLARRAIVSRR